MEERFSTYFPPAHHSYLSLPPLPPPGTAGTVPPSISQHPIPPLRHEQYSHYYHPSTFDPSPDFNDELRTLFIAGLPGDVKHREIYNLFREFPGYESCHLRCSANSSQAFAFAVFIDQRSAVSAMHALNGLIFDLEKDLALHIDLAKSNSRSKRHRSDDGLSYNEKKFKGSSVNHRGFGESGRGSNIHLPGLSNFAHSTNGYTFSQRLNALYPSTSFLQTTTISPDMFKTHYDAVMGLDDKKNISTAYVPQNSVPCPTLFLANLAPWCSEHELTEVFSSCSGFVKIKMQNKNGVPVAFVDFEDFTSSTKALNRLQGLLLYSSEADGLRLEYAKSRMGLRKRERS